MVNRNYFYFPYQLIAKPVNICLNWITNPYINKQLNFIYKFDSTYILIFSCDDLVPLTVFFNNRPLALHLIAMLEIEEVE